MVRPSEERASQRVTHGVTPAPAPVSSSSSLLLLFLLGCLACCVGAEFDVNSNKMLEEFILEHHDPNVKPCQNLYRTVCPKGLKANEDFMDKLNKAVMEMVNIDVDELEKKTSSLLGKLEKSGKDDVTRVEALLKKECKDFACLEKFYKPLYTYAQQYYKLNFKDDASVRALNGLEHMTKFANDTDYYDSYVHINAMMYNEIVSNKFASGILDVYRNLLDLEYLAQAMEKLPNATVKEVATVTKELKHKFLEEVEKTPADTGSGFGLDFKDLIRIEAENLKFEFAFESEIRKKYSNAVLLYKKEFIDAFKRWEKLEPNEPRRHVIAHASALGALYNFDPTDTLRLRTEQKEKTVKDAVMLRADSQVAIEDTFLLATMPQRNNPIMYGALVTRLGIELLEGALQMHIVLQKTPPTMNCAKDFVKETCSKTGNEDCPDTEAVPTQAFLEGVQAAYLVFKTKLTDSLMAKGYKPLKGIATNKQLFFYALAVVHCKVEEPENEHLVNGAARFFKPFSDAFGCKLSDPLMFRPNECVLLGDAKQKNEDVKKRGSEL